MRRNTAIPNGTDVSIHGEPRNAEFSGCPSAPARHPNKIPRALSARQMTRHLRLEWPKSKERSNESGMLEGHDRCTHAPTLVKLRTVQSERDEPSSKMT